MLINFDLDIKQVEDALGALKKKAPTVSRRVLGAVLSIVKKDTKREKLSGQVLNKQTGALSKSISFKTYRDGGGWIKSTSPYSAAHEFGKVIKAKQDLLTIKIDDNWIRTKSVTLPKRQFLYPVVQDYFAGQKAEQIMDSVLQDALDKIFARYGD